MPNVSSGACPFAGFRLTFSAGRACAFSAWSRRVRCRISGLPPSHRLEALSGSRRGQHSIRINDQWRVCFRWTGDGAVDIEVTDYH